MTTPMPTILKHQQVILYGEHAGYQFNRFSNGRRTIYTEVELDRENPDLGRVHWKQRIVHVKRMFPVTNSDVLHRIWQSFDLDQDGE